MRKLDGKRARVACAVSAVVLGWNIHTFGQVVFNDFSSTAGLQLNGAASATASTVDGTVLRLTPSIVGQSGSAFTLSKSNLNAGFSTFFTFRLNTFDNSGFNGADGLVFVVQNDPRGSAALGSGGGFLGLDTDGTIPAITNSYGIEFDTFQNTETDINSNHVALDVGGSVNHGLANGTPIDPIGEIRDSRLWYTWIDYTGTDVQVRMSEDGTRPASALLDLPLTVFNAQNYYVGFTAATGSGTENHDIVNWKFTNTYSPFGNVTVISQAHADGNTLSELIAPLVAGGAPGEWNNTFSWQERIIPTNSTDAFMDSGDFGPYTLYVASTSAVAQSLSMGGASGADVTLNINSGGHLGVGQDMTVGYVDNSVASVVVDGAGSQLNVLRDLTISPTNNHSQTSLSVTNGGTVNDYEAFVGLYSDSTATVRVMGMGSTWNNVFGLHIGEQGGHNSAVIAKDGGAITAGFVSVGAFGSGTLIVDGTESSLTVQHEIFIEQFGTGTFIVNHGATASCDYLEIGGFFDGNTADSGTVIINGTGTAVTVGTNTLVGYSGGYGSLTVAHGATLESGNVFVADVPDGGDPDSLSNGTLIVDGAGTLLDSVFGFTHVGFAGNGSMTVQNGGTVLSGSGFVGELPGSNGTVDIKNGSIWEVSDGLYVGGSDTAAGGTAQITVEAGASLTPATIHVWSGGTIVSSGELTTGDSIIDGSLQVSGGQTSMNNVSGNGSISVSAGILNVLSVQTGSLSISGSGFVSVAPSGGASPVNIVSSLSIDTSGVLDLTDNDLIVQTDPLAPPAFATINGLIASAFNNGDWNGFGLTSTMAQFDPNFATALGIADNAILGLTTFDGVSVNANSILVKYTYYGDANLDGVVNGADFQRFLDGLVNHGSTWLEGDFTYDGKVDLGNDFNLFLISYLRHGGALGDLAPIIANDADLTIAQRRALLAIVPEPTTGAILLAGGAASLASRRRRRAR